MAQESYIIAIDQSTQGTKGTLFDAAGKLVARADAAHVQHINAQGWVEHNPEEIAANLYKVVGDVIAKGGIDPAKVAGVGITNQRETCMAWHRETGKPNLQCHCLAVCQSRADL